MEINADEVSLANCGGWDFFVCLFAWVFLKGELFGLLFWFFNSRVKLSYQLELAHDM